MKKAVNAIINVLSTLVMVVAVCVMIFTIVSVNTFNRQDRSLMGYKAFIVLSDSMSATDFDAGDLVLTKDVNPAELQEGDIIAYISENPDNYGEVVTHKIRTVNPDGTFTTYGTTTDTDDAYPVSWEQVLGKYDRAIPKVGAFFNFLKTTPGYICCIFVPFALLIMMQGLNTVKLFKQYKREQQEDIDRQKAELEQERLETKAMMEELLAMKREMAQQQQVNEVTEE